MIFGYKGFLERENERLRERIDTLEARNQELLQYLYEKIPVSQKKTETPVQHQMKKGETQASCSCGWNTFSDDPVKLQQEISSHFRKYAAPAGRKSWAQTKNILESAGDTQ